MIDIKINFEKELSADLFLGCIGYEKRSSHVLQNISEVNEAVKVMFDYRAIDDNGEAICSYAENIKIATRENVELENNFERFLFIISECIEKNKTTKVIIDITSFDRRKISKIILLLFKLSANISDVRFIYAPRVFKEFDLFKFDVVQSFGPVLPEFFGTSDGFEKPLTLILGAGYEYGKAVGAIDTLEPDHIYCFRPTGTDVQFDKHIDIANVDFSFMQDKEDIFYFDMNDPVILYSNLRSLVEYEMTEQNVLLLPLGPKIFAAMSILIASILHPKVMVWRHSTVSTKQPETLLDAETTGDLVNFTFKFDQ